MKKHLFICLFLWAGVANALTVTESTDFGNGFPPDPLGLLSVGINTISGSLGTTCIATGGMSADCSSGDNVDSFDWILSNGFELSDASVTITNFTTTGTLASDQLGLGRIGNGFSLWSGDGILNLDLNDAFDVPNKASIMILSLTNISPVFLQGIGDISYDYTLSLNVTASAVPVPAAVWLFGTGLIGLFGASRRRVN